MKEKKISLAKKKFLIIFFLLGIFFNSENIFAEKNLDLEKKLKEIQSNINNFRVEENLCITEEEKEKMNQKNFDENKSDFTEVFHPEEYGIPEKAINDGKKGSDKYFSDLNTKEVSSNSMQETIDSFTIQFSGNYCFQRDLKKINKNFYESINHGNDLAKNCYFKDNEEYFDKYLLEIKKLKKIKNDFEAEELGNSKYYNYKKGKLYSLEFGKNLCKEDSITDAFNKIEKLKKKVNSIGGDSFKEADIFFTNVGKIWNGDDKNELGDFLKKIDEETKKEAKNYVLRNFTNSFGSVIQLFGLGNHKPQSVKFAIKNENTITETVKNDIEKSKKSDKKKDEGTKTELKGLINNILNETQLKEINSEYSNYAKDFFEKESMFYDLEEDATNKIMANLIGLEGDIIFANGNPEELQGGFSNQERKSVMKRIGEAIYKSDKDILEVKTRIDEGGGENSKELKTLRNFILKFSDFLDTHNESTGTVESQNILKTDEKINN